FVQKPCQLERGLLKSLAEPRPAADTGERGSSSVGVTLYSSPVRLRPGVIAPRKLGVSYKGKVPAGEGRAPHPYRVWRPWARRGWTHDEHDGRSVDSVSWRPEG